MMDSSRGSWKYAHLAAQDCSGDRLAVVEAAEVVVVVDWAVARTKREETAMMLLNFIVNWIDCKNFRSDRLESQCKKEKGRCCYKRETGVC